MFNDFFTNKCCETESIFISDPLEYGHLSYKLDGESQPSGEGFLKEENEIAI
jgi:hypothetical protein